MHFCLTYTKKGNNNQCYPRIFRLSENIAQSRSHRPAPFTRLHQAHRALDKAVDAAYGYKGGHDDGSRTAFLFALYQKAAAEAGKR